MIITLPCSSHHPPVGQHCCLLGRSPGLSFTGERAGNTLNEKKLKQVGEVKSLVMTEQTEMGGGGCRGADTLRGSEIRGSRTPLRYMTLGEEKRKNIPLCYKWEPLGFFRNMQAKIKFTFSLLWANGPCFFE